MADFKPKLITCLLAATTVFQDEIRDSFQNCFTHIMFVRDQTKAGVVDRGTAFGPNTFKLMDHIKKLDKSNPETGLVTVITTYNTFQYRTFK